VDQDVARARFAAAAVARMATVTPDGRPHLVPVTFAAAGDRVVTAIDHKPKRPGDLARLRNLRDDPRVCLLADHYDDRWEELWWVRADGSARILTPEDVTAREAIRLLAERYPQYREHPPQGPVIVISVSRWSGWAWRTPAVD
jgi:PPOX class probable F420-dependent enzyme